MNLWQGFFFIFITSILGYQPVSNNRYAIMKTVSTLVDRWLSSSNPISYLDDVSLHPHTSGPCYNKIYILSNIWSKQLSYHIFTLCPLLLDSSDYSGRFTLSRLRGVSFIGEKFPYGWGGWVRTSECGSQSPVPYHLATPHQKRFL